MVVDRRPPDLDEARAAAGMGPAFAEAAGLLSEDLFHVVPFQSLAAVKNHLKHFFSREPWNPTDEAALGEILMFNLEAADGWWEHDLTGGFRLAHGFREGRYHLWVTGGGQATAPSPFDRVFSGPVVPEATPNPRHVRFPIGGAPSPGRWYSPGDEPDDGRVAELMADPDVADVLVAGDFVSIGLRKAGRWEERIDDLLETVIRLFWDSSRASQSDGGAAGTPSRDELVAGGQRRTELHLLDPDEPADRTRLEEAAASPGPQERRMALATLAHSEDDAYVRDRLAAGYADPSRLVRRAVIDAAVDREDEELRPLFERALADSDAWTRWKALRGLRELGAGPSREAIAALAADPDFQVRFEVAAALREA